MLAELCLNSNRLGQAQQAAGASHGAGPHSPTVLFCLFLSSLHSTELHASDFRLLHTVSDLVCPSGYCPALPTLADRFLCAAFKTADLAEGLGPCLISLMSSHSPFILLASLAAFCRHFQAETFCLGFLLCPQVIVFLTLYLLSTTALAQYLICN